MNVLRTAGSAVAIIAFSFAVATSAIAASPAPDTLGARVTSIVVIADSPDLSVTNLGTVAESFSFAPSAGWAVSPTDLVLAPSQTGTVRLSGTGDPGTVVITGRAAVAVVGTDQSAIQFTSKVMVNRPINFGSIAFTGGGVVLGLLTLFFVLRRVRPWQWRVTRAASPDAGQGLAEYALILALVAIIAILALIFLGSQVSHMLSAIGNAL